MNNTGYKVFPADQSQTQFQYQSQRGPSLDSQNSNKDDEEFLRVPQPDIIQFADEEQEQSQVQQKVIIPLEQKVYNKYTGPQSIVTDEYAEKRQDYRIKSNLNLYRECNKPEDKVLFWQNHEGTKSVILELKCQDSKTDLKFTLIDSRYSILSQQQYQFDKEFEIKGFQFSYDESYLAIQVDWDQYLFCYFENGFENDLFDEGIGNYALQKMLLTTFKIEGLEKPDHIQFRISGDNRFLLFPEYKNEWPYYASQNTVEHLKNNQKVLLSINDDFELKNIKPRFKKIIQIDGPYIIGFDQEENFLWIYNYELVREYTQDDKMLLLESKDLTKYNVIFFSNLNEPNLRHQFFFFGSKNLFIYFLCSYDHYNTLRGHLSPFSYPSDFINCQRKKIIEGNSIVCCRGNYLYFYDIDYQNYKIELKTKISGFLSYDLMKNSNQMCLDNTILNFKSSPYQNNFNPIIMNRGDRVIGLNSFNEFLSLRDFNAYAHKAFPNIELPKNLIFYSKRLNLYVTEGCTAHFLNKQDSQEIKHGQIKSLVIDGQEILRIFDTKSDSKMITCFTFTEDDNIIKYYETNFESKFILSEDSDEIAIINQGSINIIKVNEKHMFYTYKDSNDKVFEQLKFQGDFRFFNRIIIIEKQMYRFSEDYSQIVASTNIYSQLSIFYIKSNILIELINNIAIIYDIKNLQIRSKIQFDRHIFYPNYQLNDYRINKLESNYLYIEYIGTSNLRRIQVANNDEIFGVRLTNLNKPNLISQINFSESQLEYFPMNAEGTTENNDRLACTLLQFYLNPLTEYYDIGGYYEDQENEMIKNINRADSSINDVTPFNLLHNNFSLQLLLKQEASRILPHVLKKLQLNADQGKILPYFMIQDQNYKLSLLEQAIKDKDLMAVNTWMELFIKADQQGLLYADYISPHLFAMKKLGIDLKPLFESKILFHQVSSENRNFPQYKPEFKYCIVSSNAKYLEDVVLREQFNFEIEEQKEEQLAFKIEYQIVNMKDNINIDESEGKKQEDKTRKTQQIIQLFDELSDKDITYLDIELLQVIIKFKWDKYTYKYFLVQFVLWLLFIVSFILDLAFGNLYYGIDNQIGFYFTRGICQFILLRFLNYEIHQLTQNWRDYFSSVWNICDLFLHLVYPSYIFVSFYCQSELYAIKSLQCFIILLAFIKFLFLLRIFKRFSFLIQMLVTVFQDLTSFLYFFGFVVIFFSIFVGILIKDLSDYEGIGTVAYFVISLRESIGDYDTASFTQNTEYKIIGWIVYLMVMFLGNVIFMNFIIAVISQSYENCMQRSVAQSYKVKLHMIRERESIMSKEEYQNEDWFPNYIILCKPLSEGRNSEGGEMENEWNGLLKEIEKGVKRQFESTNQQQKKIISSIENEIKILAEETNQTKESNKKMMEEMKVEMITRMEELKVLLTKK